MQKNKCALSEIISPLINPLQLLALTKDCRVCSAPCVILCRILLLFSFWFVCMFSVFARRIVGMLWVYFKCASWSNPYLTEFEILDKSRFEGKKEWVYTICTISSFRHALKFEHCVMFSGAFPASSLVKCPEHVWVKHVRKQQENPWKIHSERAGHPHTWMFPKIVLLLWTRLELNGCLYLIR